MASERLGVLGNTDTASTMQNLYSVPSGKQAVVSRLDITNPSNVDIVITVAISPAGATYTAKHARKSNYTIPANSDDSIGKGWTLGATDVLRVQSSRDDTSFMLFGSEVTV